MGLRLREPAQDSAPGGSRARAWTVSRDGFEGRERGARPTRRGVASHASAPRLRGSHHLGLLSFVRRAGVQRLQGGHQSRRADRARVVRVVLAPRRRALRVAGWAVRGRARPRHARTVETRTLRVEAGRDAASRLALVVPGRDEPVAPTHWSFGQLCSFITAPASYLRQLPAPLAGTIMQHGLLANRAELVKTLGIDDGRVLILQVAGRKPRLWSGRPSPGCPHPTVPVGGLNAAGW